MTHRKETGSIRGNVNTCGKISQNVRAALTLNCFMCGKFGEFCGSSAADICEICGSRAANFRKFCRLFCVGKLLKH